MAIVVAAVVVGNSGSMMRAGPAASVRVPRAAEKQVWASAVAAVMLAVAAAVVVGGLGQEGSWVGM